MKNNTLLFIQFFYLVIQPGASASDVTSNLSLEQLLALSINGASKYEQKQSDVAASVCVITRNEIRAFGWRTMDEALASLPGIYTTYDRQHVYLGTRGIGVSGDYNTRALVLINGNRVNDPFYDGGPVGREFPLDIDLIERIEYIPGPGGAVYGQNAMFGVVNVITRRGATIDGTELAAAYQRPQAQREGRASWGRLFDNGVDALVSVSGLRARGEDLFFTFPGAAIPSGRASGLDGGRSGHFFAHMSSGDWSIEHVYSSREKDDPTGAFFSDPLVGGQNQGNRYALTQLQYQHTGDTMDFTGRLFRGRQSYYVNSSYVTPSHLLSHGDWVGAEMRLLSTAIDNHKLMLGFEAQNNSRTEQTVQDLANSANNIVIPGSGYRLGLYAQDEWHIDASLTSTLGLRIDHNSITGTKLSPRAALIWHPAPPTDIKALYGRAHRAPNTFERNSDAAARAGNAPLNGETIDTLELVIDQRIGRDLTLRSSVYRWTMQGLVTLAGVTPFGEPQYRNAMDLNAHGLELSAHKIWNGYGHLRASLSYQKSSYANGGELANSPQLMGKLNVSAPFASTGLCLGYELQYYGKRLLTDGTELAGYGLANLNVVAKKLARGVEVSFNVHNLFDRRYAHPAAGSNWQKTFSQDRRSARIELDYRF